MLKVENGEDKMRKRIETGILSGRKKAIQKEKRYGYNKKEKGI